MRSANAIRKRSLLLTVAPTLLLASACVSADFQEPVGSFTRSMSTANGVIGTYFLQMNDFERETYLQRALYDPTVAIAVTDAQGRPTGLMPFFSAESIKARMASLALLTTYGERLAALAGADAPARFNAGSQVLGQNLANLHATFSNLAGTGDSTAANYTGPISTIIGIFGEMILDAERDRALTRAVRDGAPAVEQILRLLETDLDRVVRPLQETGLIQQLANAQAYYNANRARMSFSERRAALEAINQAAARYQAAIAANPSEAIDGIRDAHAALVEYANSPRRPEDLSALVSAIETFNNRLRPIVENLRKLVEA